MGPDLIDPDRLAELEEERRFLLRSLTDLEREREAGDVDHDDYVALRDGYTARAATVLRAIDEGRSALPPRPPRNWARRIITIAAVVALGVVAGILVSLYSGQRTPGDTITGGTSPDQVAVLLSEARALRETGNLGPASERYVAALEIDPDNVEALTYAGWLLVVSSQDQADAAAAELRDRGVDLLDEAIVVDPSYADPFCFLSIIAVVFDADAAEGARRREQCVANNPSTDMRNLIDEFVPADAEAGTTDAAVPTSTG